MSRDPSIHLSKSQFLRLLEDMGIEGFPTDNFFVQARKVALNTRAILVSNKKDTKQVNKILLATKGDAAMVADIVYATRIKLHHRGIRKINETQKRDWSLCKDLANICNQFSQDFNFKDARAGFIAYINIGFKRMGRDHRNILTRLIAMAENIYAYYESEQAIQEDTNPRLTNSLYEYYNKRVADSTGIYERAPLNQDPDKYNHFYQIRILCDDNKWDYQDFIDAQFDGMAWCNGLPEPHNMYGPKAIERYKKFVYKYKGTDKSEPEEIEGGLWNKISNG